VLDISKRDQIPTFKAADRMAEERIERMRKSRRQFLQNGQHILSRR
jgi:leucine dehydrogenase